MLSWPYLVATKATAEPGNYKFRNICRTDPPKTSLSIRQALLPCALTSLRITWNQNIVSSAWLIALHSTSEGWHIRKTNFKTDPMDVDCDFGPLEAQVSWRSKRHFVDISASNSKAKKMMCQMLSLIGTTTDPMKNLPTIHTYMFLNRCPSISG